MKPIADRLWAKTDIRNPDECWEWRGWRHPRAGHGQIGKGRRSDGLTYTHIVAWEVTNGPIPAGMNVCHKCDNPPCVNPSHLFLGTIADNVRDMVNKRRHSFGEAHADKLSEGNVIEIRHLLVAGMTQKEIAKKFDISRSMVGLIGQFERWELAGIEASVRLKLSARPLPGAQEMCRRGHIYAEVGFYISGNSGRLCKVCHLLRMQKYLESGGREKKRLSSKRR